ncbi:MAG: transglutaminase-like domain-containing protein [Methanobrevibacter sp.]|uniref:transglutaminase-like domain-containing protein n=1 Tax=Methanobrevibacter sp. TaxID=66852 RepID=UPI0026DFB9E2|nr:transglutaminase-like domain-containing protein [Methanobrevibacter sp.]MDO5849316.1 transglutaminase-like domain-containing protein [Methanobrevibacter sp.]
MVIQYSIPRNLLEVYKVDTENFEQYIPNSGEETTVNESSDDEDTTTNEDDENMEGFSLHQGEILETYYYGNLYNVDSEHDYENISNNGSISMPEVDKKRFYKGVRILLRKGWEQYDEPIEPVELNEMLLGFITEQTYSEDKVDLKISGMTKLLEQKYQFDFTQMKMSEILAEMIKTAGMEPVIDPTGLNDMVIDYSNVSSSGDEDGGDSDVSGVGFSTTIKEQSNRICKGKKGAIAKAKAICHWVYKNIQYERPMYYGAKHSPTEVLKCKTANCVDHARLINALCSVQGIKTGYVNTHCMGYAHVYNGIVIKDKVYMFDASIESAGGKWDSTWGSCPRATKDSLRYNWEMWGSLT